MKASLSSFAILLLVSSANALFINSCILNGTLLTLSLDPVKLQYADTRVETESENSTIAVNGSIPTTVSETVSSPTEAIGEEANDETTEIGSESEETLTVAVTELVTGIESTTVGVKDSFEATTTINAKDSMGETSNPNTTVNAIAPTVNPTAPTVTPISSTVPKTPNPDQRYSVNIYIINGFIPHNDIATDGDIKVYVRHQSNYLGSTRKVQDTWYPGFYESFQVKNASGSDSLKFSIWDIDPQFDDYEGMFQTNCNQVLSGKINGVGHKYYPDCHASSYCWLKVAITCSPIGYISNLISQQ